MSPILSLPSFSVETPSGIAESDDARPPTFACEVQQDLQVAHKVPKDLLGEAFFRSVAFASARKSLTSVSPARSVRKTLAH